MYYTMNVPIRVRVNGTFKYDVLVQIGSRQDSAVIRLLFIIVLELLSREIKSGCLENVLYVDNLALDNITLSTRKGELFGEKHCSKKG